MLLIIALKCDQIVRPAPFRVYLDILMLNLNAAQTPFFVIAFTIRQWAAFCVMSCHLITCHVVEWSELQRQTLNNIPPKIDLNYPRITPYMFFLRYASKKRNSAGLIFVSWIKHERPFFSSLLAAGNLFGAFCRAARLFGSSMPIGSMRHKKLLCSTRFNTDHSWNKPRNEKKEQTQGGKAHPVTKYNFSIYLLPAALAPPFLLMLVLMLIEVIA